MKLRNRIVSFLLIVALPLAAAQAYNAQGIIFTLEMNFIGYCSSQPGLACPFGYWSDANSDWLATHFQVIADHYGYYATGQCSLPQYSALCAAMQDDIVQTGLVVNHTQMRYEQYM